MGYFRPKKILLNDTYFFKSTNGIVFVYDITNKRSFEGVKDSIKDAENNGAEFEKILIGNKCDLEGKREVAKDTLDKYGIKKKLKLLKQVQKLMLK